MNIKRVTILLVRRTKIIFGKAIYEVIKCDRLLFSPMMTRKIY